MVEPLKVDVPEYDYGKSKGRADGVFLVLGAYSVGFLTPLLAIWIMR